MSQMNNQSLQQQLETLVSRGRQHLRALSKRAAFERASKLLPGALLATAVVSLLWVLINKFVTWYVPSTTQILLSVVFAVLICVVVIFAMHIAKYRVKREIALSYIDRAFDLKDRLQTADEYNNKAQLSSFEQAALKDAKKHVDQALVRQLPEVQLAPANLSETSLKQAVVGMFVLMTSLWVNATDFDVLDGQRSASEIPQALALVPGESSTQTEDYKANGAQAGKQIERASLSNPVANQAQPETEPTLGRQQKKPQKPTVGSVSQGNSEPSQSASNQNSSGGQGNQAKSSESNAKKKKPSKAKLNKPKASQPQEMKDGDKSKINGGSGSSSGKDSSAGDKNQSPDQAPDGGSKDDSDNIGEDEEDEQQDADGAAQKPSSARKAPASRQLTVSAPNVEEENVNANGRGGLTGMKKTRGVATMLLGVPLPDRLIGSNNPGRTKSSSSQSTPAEDVAAATHAGQRGESDNSTGQLPKAKLQPWSKALIRDYFLSQRNAAKD